MTKISRCLAALSLVFLIAASDATAAPTVTKFDFTGAEQTFTVPAGGTSIHVVAIGGKGGIGELNRRPGGFGAAVSADVAVTPGQVLSVMVGGNGGDAPGTGAPGSGGFNNGGAGGGSLPGRAGGGGGGMSYLAPSGGFTDALVVAGGGGGSAGGFGGGFGGNGSDADGKNGQSGGTGDTVGNTPGGAAGGGGTTTGAGKGTDTAQDGHFAGGGTGADGLIVLAPDLAAGSGGGGGAGRWGGAGGGSHISSINPPGGGGGAGSSTASADATNVSYTRDKTGVPSITLTYDLPQGPGGGAGGGGGGGNSPALAPALTNLKASPRTFVAANRGGSTGGTVGTNISYTSAVAGTTTFTVLAPRRGVTAAKCVKPKRGRRGKRCTRYVSLGTFTHQDVAGFNTFVFTGRVRHHKLARGSYRLQAISRSNGNKSSPVTLSFRIGR